MFFSSTFLKFLEIILDSFLILSGNGDAQVGEEPKGKSKGCDVSLRGSGSAE
jgi:hypothetical protein